jgi:hypothetical protein
MEYTVGLRLTGARTSGSVENGLLSTDQMREVRHHTVVRLRGTRSTQISTEGKKVEYANIYGGKKSGRDSTPPENSRFGKQVGNFDRPKNYWATTISC